VNAEEMTALVDRARAVEPASPPPPDLLPRARASARRHRLTVAGLGLLGAALVIAPATVVVARALDEGQPTPATSAVEDVSPRCPDTLPVVVDPGGHGFGPVEEADRRPALPEPRSAWVCEYVATSSSVTDSGTVWSWVSQGGPRSVDAAAVPRLADDLQHLGPPAANRACTDDLGPRWLLVYPHGSGLIGVVVDDYGCRDVRLTDDPFTTTAGAADADGTVPGILTAPDGMLERIKAAWGA